jgi:predicted nucleic acid-binding protein
VILVDTGFWIALGSRRDRHHDAAETAMQRWMGEGFVTTWPVIAETCHLLRMRLGTEAMLQFMQHLSDGVCEIAAASEADIPRLRSLMHKYRDLPMDLADASLVVLAEQLEEGRILSTDERDFRAYRWKNTKPFKNLLTHV